MNSWLVNYITILVGELYHESWLVNYITKAGW